MQTTVVTNGHKASGPLTDLFFDLIQCSIGKKERLSRTPDAQEWAKLFDIAQMQTLVGITYSGIERLPKEQHPSKQILLGWHTSTELIKERNIELNRMSIAISGKFKELGFRNTLLKGQGLAQLYPTPNLRTPGDIDIWLDGGCDKILGYVRKCFPKCKPTYHHVDFPVKKETGIEVHFTPSWMHSPIRNRRAQEFFNSNAVAQFRNDITTPQGSFPSTTLSFNRVYILLHIYRHLFQEGIGLRQLLDYYFVLEKGFSQNERTECTKTLKKLGLTGFAAAATYILQEKFGLEREKHLVPPDKRRGEFLLREVMTAGNFGKYDCRYPLVSKDNEFKHFLNSMQRTARLILQYPSETLWSPYFKIWHYFWRKRHKV